MSNEDWVGEKEPCLPAVTADTAVEEACGFVTQPVLMLWERTILPTSVTGDLAPRGF